MVNQTKYKEIRYKSCSEDLSREQAYRILNNIRAYPERSKTIDQFFPEDAEALRKIEERMTRQAVK